MVEESSDDERQSVEQTSLLSEPATEQQCMTQIYLKPTYRIRKLKNKGAIVVLIWNFFIISVFNYLTGFIVPNGVKINTIALGLTMPIAGWLTDICFGRYKMIRWSIWIMWTAAILTTMNSVVAELVPGHHGVLKGVSLLMSFMLAIGFGGYQANIIQFGLDQLQDASTTEITAFISWYVWTNFCNDALMNFTHICIKPKYYLFVQLIVCISITIVISSLYFLEDLLVKEPATQNPFTLIYKVIKYAIKNKHPRCRSAFTYCEDELPSRIDFGKSKYGGPFTTEQVEDVKTFLRLLVIIVVASILLGEGVVLFQFNNLLIRIFQHAKSTLSYKECYTERFSVIAFGSGAAALLIPLYEFILYPFLHTCFSSVKIYQKFLIGLMVQIPRIIMLMAFNISARNTYIKLHGHNSSIPCGHSGSLGWSSYRNWMAIPNFLDMVSVTMVSISSFELLASQTPYSMRGLMIGVAYGSIFIFTMIGYGIYWPFKHLSSNWGTGIISCEFWYLLSVLLVLIIFSGLLLAAGRWYKNRKREDVLPNEHIFAERYYASQHECNLT